LPKSETDLLRRETRREFFARLDDDIAKHQTLGHFAHIEVFLDGVET